MAVTWTTQRTGNWSLISSNASSPWYDAGAQTALARTPGSSSNANNDLVIIANGHTLTCDASVTIGDATTPASKAITTAGTGGTGVLSVSSGVALTVVSNVNQANAAWSFGAGSSLTFSSATALTWQLSDSTGQFSCKLSFNGSSGSRITVTGTNSAAHTIAWGGLSVVAQIDAAYTDFSNLGSSSVRSLYGNCNNNGAWVFRLTNCTLANCGPVACSTNNVNTTFDVSNCQFSSSSATYNLYNVQGGTAVGTGTRRISNCTLDKGLGASSTWKDFTIAGNFMGALPSLLTSGDNRVAEISNNFQVYPVFAAAVNVPSNWGSYLNNWNYLHVHSSSGISNMHGFSPNVGSGISSEVSGWIFDPGFTDTTGDLIFLPASGSAGATLTVRYNLVLPIATGASAGGSMGKLVSCISDPTNITATIDHNTVCSSGTGETGVLQWGETQKGLVGMVTSLRSNLAFTPSGSTAGVKVQKTATTALSGTVSVTNGSPTVTGSSTTFTTKLIAGDWIQVGSDNAVYQVQTVASNTSLTLATNYGGTTGSGKTVKPYVKDAVYNAGYTAADYNAGWGLAAGTDGKGYNGDVGGATIFGYTPGPNDISLGSNPFVDSTRNLATWAVAKGVASSGDTYQAKVDAAYTYLKADPANRISDLVTWVKAGWSVSAASLNNAGHDGVTIGALGYQATAGAVPAAAMVFTPVHSAQYEE